MNLYFIFFVFSSITFTGQSKIFKETQWTNGTVNQDKVDRVHNLELFDLNTTFLSDGLPIYFHSKFTTFNQSFKIFFKRDSIQPNNKPPLPPKSVYSTFNSLHLTINNIEQSPLFNANAALYLSPRGYNLLINNSQAHLTNWINSNQPNLTLAYNIILTIKTPNSVLKIDFDNDGRYICHINQVPSTPTPTPTPSQTPKKSKRDARRGKQELIIESCVHIHYDFYLMVKNYLKTDDLEYTRVYLSILFGQIIKNVDSIYDRLNKIYDDFFTVNLEFTELVIHTEYNSSFDIFSTPFYPETVEFLKFINLYVQDYYMRTTNSTGEHCDHVFYLHTYQIGASAGIAYVQQACSYNSHTSSVKYSAMVDLIMAHELAHNLGVAHDPVVVKERKCKEEMNLMYYMVVHKESGFHFSECTFLELKYNMFDEKQVLKKSISCLLNRTTSMVNERSQLSFYSNIGTQVLPGHIYSLSDQCRLMTNDPNSYSCSSVEKDICLYLFCYKSKVKACEGAKEALDGTSCGVNKICIYYKCVDVKSYKRYKSWDLESYKPVSKYEYSSGLIKSNCPAGTSQEQRAIANPPTNLADYYTQISCDLALFPGSREIKRFGFCGKTSFYDNICCEKCIKYRMNNCSYEEPCEYPTCETLKSNPCFNDGLCVTDKSAIGADNTNVAFNCICKPGFTGNFII